MSLWLFLTLDVRLIYLRTNLPYPFPSYILLFIEKAIISIVLDKFSLIKSFIILLPLGDILRIELQLTR